MILRSPSLSLPLPYWSKLEPVSCPLIKKSLHSFLRSLSQDMVSFSSGRRFGIIANHFSLQKNSNYKKRTKKLISIRCSFGSIIRSNICLLLSYLCTHHFKYFANTFSYGNFEHHDVYHWIWVSYFYHYLFWKRSTSIPPSIC